jgi:hypothetical protein
MIQNNGERKNCLDEWERENNFVKNPEKNEQQIQISLKHPVF